MLCGRLFLRLGLFNKDEYSGKVIGEVIYKLTVGDSLVVSAFAAGHFGGLAVSVFGCSLAL